MEDTPSAALPHRLEREKSIRYIAMDRWHSPAQRQPCGANSIAEEPPVPSIDPVHSPSCHFHSTYPCGATEPNLSEKIPFTDANKGSEMTCKHVNSADNGPERFALAPASDPTGRVSVLGSTSDPNPLACFFAFIAYRSSGILPLQQRSEEWFQPLKSARWGLYLQGASRMVEQAGR